MTQEQFIKAMKRAKLFHILYLHDDYAEFYQGLQFGLRRFHFGNIYGSEAEHKKFMSLSPWFQEKNDKKIDWDKMKNKIIFDKRRLFGMGYRLGFNYEHIPQVKNLPSSENIRDLAYILGWSVLELSVYCGVSHDTALNWLDGLPISPKAAEKLKKLCSWKYTIFEIKRNLRNLSFFS
jgi:hypothetical protein